MASDDASGRYGLFLLGMGIGGALAVLAYLVRHWGRLPLPIVQDSGAPASSAAGVRIKAPEQPASATLTMHVTPSPLVSGEEATVRALTIPEATCIIAAHYSTGRPPSSLDTRPQKADSAGEAEWTWNVRTMGDYVIIEVQAWSEGREIERVEQRVEIVQEA